ncbi:MAG: MraY family glycosyltransferase [Patescibacteria group bacterium]
MTSLNYIYTFFTAFIISLGLTYILRKIALKFQIVDRPEISPERKIQKSPVPLLGGLAIFLAFFITLLIFKNQVISDYILPKYLWGIFIGALLLMFGGFLDDKYNLKAKKQIIWPILAVLITVGAGIGVKYISNPFGGFIWLDTLKFNIFTIGGVPYYLTIFADLFALAWLLGMMYTTKFLDGLDGLVGGITVIGSVVIFFMSLTHDVNQSATALLCLILGGAALGFLIFNFHPARIFLGEGGSLFCGFMLGVLSIISGGKIATALLIMGIPILDVIWVIIRRSLLEKKSPFNTSDKKHLHFRLLDVGFSHRGAVLFLYALTIIFGSTTLFFKGFSKLVSLVVLAFVMIILGLVLVLVYKNKQKKKEA